MRRLGWFVLASLLATACSQETERPLERRKLLNRLRDARPAGRIVAIRGLAAEADREELVAIVRAADGASEEVRIEVARALGASKRPEAVEFLGAMVVSGATARADASDAVRAEAIAGLALQGGPKADAYLVRAFAHGGPASRAAVAAAGADALKHAIAAETSARKASLLAAAHAGPPPARAAALEELGDHGTPDVVAVLDEALASENPLVASGAAHGIARADAKQLVPQLTRVVGAGRPGVVAAAAHTLAELGAGPAKAELLSALARNRPEETDALLAALETIAADDEMRGAACAAALTSTHRSGAIRALRLAGASCVVPVEVPETNAAARLALLTERKVKDARVLARARTLLGDEDAELAIAAARYLTAIGDRADGARLLAAAETQHRACLEGWLERRRVMEAKRLATKIRDEDAKRQFEGIIEDTSKLDRPESKLEALVARRRAASESATFEPRDGAVDFLVAAGVGAARLGADVTMLVETLLNDEQSRLPIAAIAIADASSGEAAREKCRTHADPAVQAEMAIADLTAGRPGAAERAGKLLALAEAETAARLVEALTPNAAAMKEALMQAAGSRGAAVGPAVHALGPLVGDDVTELLVDRVRSSGGHGAFEASIALANRDGALATKGLLVAATHPMPEVQTIALEALAARKACGSPSLAALSDAFDRRVREAAGRFVSACGTTSPSAQK